MESVGSFRTYSISGETAFLVPEFAVEDMPSAELQSRFLGLQWRSGLWAEHPDDDEFINIMIFLNKILGTNFLVQMQQVWNIDLSIFTLSRL